MRLPRARFTLRTMMFAVFVIGVTSAVIVSVCTERTRRIYLGKVSKFAELETQERETLRQLLDSARLNEKEQRESARSALHDMEVQRNLSKRTRYSMRYAGGRGGYDDALDSFSDAMFQMSMRRAVATFEIEWATGRPRPS